MTAKKIYRIHVHTRPVGFTGSKWQYETTLRKVRVLAIAEGWAMVRYMKGTYCVLVKDLKEETGGIEP